MGAAHAKLSASGAHRWLACPGSIRMSEGIESPQSEYAAEGTAAHALAERCLRDGVDAKSFIDTSIDDFVVDEEMADAVQIYLDFVRSLPGQRFVEQRVAFDDHVPDGFGTVDALVLDADTQTLHVVDLKYGQGVQVNAEENPQGACYALGAFQEYGWLEAFERVHIVIVQPRLDHISEWDTTVEVLQNWANGTLAPAAEAALKDDAPLVPGETQCRFCPAKGTCRALADHAMAAASDGFSSTGEPKDVEPLAPDEVGALLDRVPLVELWLKAIRSKGTALLNAGKTVPGWKLVRGRSQRHWDDETVVDKALARAKIKAADRYTKKLISPAQAEKRLGKDHPLLSRHVVRPDGAPTLAPESDKRPAIKVDPAAGFASQNPSTELEKADG
ncbi:MAG: DUF2800 domain-containing protein [Devosia sp.]